MAQRISLVVLSGGRNSRMHGLNKGMLRLGEETFLDRIYRTARPLVSEALLVTRHPALYRKTGFRPVEDIYSLRSSLTGIHAGLTRASNQWSLVLPCDVPLVKRDLLSLLIAKAESGVDAVVPRCGTLFEPLCALYAKSCLEYADELLQANRPKISNLFERIRLRTLEEAELRQVDPELESFVNVNTAEDLARLQHRCGSARSQGVRGRLSGAES